MRRVALVFVLLAVSASTLSCGEGSVETAPAEAEPASAWTRLQPPREVPEGSTLLWAGDRYLLYGGCAHDYGSSGGCGRAPRGVEYDPEADLWSPIPRSPEGIRGPSVWTGEEAIFLSGGPDTRRGVVAYDPSARTWRELPDAPFGGVNQAIWAGDQLLAWGGKDRFGSGLAEGAAYDPSADSWRSIAAAPISLNLFDLAWTGSEVIAFGSQLDGRNSADSKVAVGAAYDPTADGWREIADSELSPQASAASWDGSELVAYDYGGEAQLYDPDSDTWSEPERIPIDAGECYPDSVAAGGFVVGFYCGQIVLFDPADSSWHRITGGLTEREHERIPVWRFSQTATDGEEIVFLAEGLTFGSTGTPRYNFPDSPISMWSYRPDVPSEAPPLALRTCGPKTNAGGWSTSVAGISCDEAGRVILRVLIRDFDDQVLSQYRYTKSALEKAGPGEFESSGYECTHSAHDEDTGWFVECSRGTEALAFYLTP